MMNAATQRYFESITNSEIERKLSFLRANLPKKPTRSNYQLSKRLLKVRRRIKEENLQANLQEISDQMRAHLRIDRPIKILTVANVEAGKFESIGDLYCIYINGDLKNQSYAQKLAILAHEISHFYLIYQHKIYLKDTNENEFLTEINAIYTGLGLLLLDGYQVYEKQKGSTIYKSRVGYIDTPTVKFAIIRTAYLRKQNPIWILKNVGLLNVPYFLFGLFKLVKDYYKTKQVASRKA